MPKKKEEKVVEKDDLLDDLNKLDDPKPDDVIDPPDEPELSIVDKFVSGDMEAVKQSIQDQVIKSVSDVVNGTPPADDPAPED